MVEFEEFLNNECGSKYEVASIQSGIPGMEEEHWWTITCVLQLKG